MKVIADESTFVAFFFASGPVRRMTHQNKESLY